MPPEPTDPRTGHAAGISPADGRAVDARTLDPFSLDQLVAASGLPRIEARLLLEVASGRAREWLIAHGDERAEAGVATRFDTLRRRRLAGEPIAYLTGRREFHGRDFEVGPEVLIPRPETEGLVDLALALAPDGARLADLGTGSGCIAVTLAAEREDLRILATDVSDAALAIAARNARLHCERALAEGRLRLLRADWWAGVPAHERFDLVVSNPPYIASDDAHLSQGDLRFEPAAALTDGGDGLGALRAIAAGAGAHLAPGGRLLLEHGWDQASPVSVLLAAAGFSNIVCHRDAAGLPRVTEATLTLGQQAS